MGARGDTPGNEFDPLAEAVRADPHSMYRQLRSSCPVAHTEAFGGFWTATRRSDIERITTDPATFSSRYGIIVPRNRASGRRPPLHFDPPEHALFRAAINPAFRKDRLARLELIIRDRAGELARQACAANEFDGFGDIASPLAATTVGHLLNLPAHLLRPMTDHAARFEWAQFHFDLDAVEAENLILYDLSRRFVAERRTNQLDPDEDLVSGLLAVDPERLAFLAEPGEPFDESAVDEIVAGSVRQIIVAGHGAPALVLASAIGHLADDAQLQSELRARPELLADATEELLRLHTPNQGFARTVVEPVELGGRRLPAGAMVAIPYTSANRDEAVFHRPDELVLGRSTRHLAFGFGVHICPGAHIGRVQTRVALEALLGATSAIERRGPSEYAPFPVHGPITLPLRVVAA